MIRLLFAPTEASNSCHCFPLSWVRSQKFLMSIMLGSILISAPLQVMAVTPNSTYQSIDRTINPGNNQSNNASAVTAMPPVEGTQVQPQPNPNTIQTTPAKSSPQGMDYAANLNSDVFGANLFTGAFAQQGSTSFNPDYALTVGDSIRVHIWGAFEFDSILTIDPKGNIFLPHVGPIKVGGVRNQDLQKLIQSAVGKVFRSNVHSYASLATAQPVRVFISGYAHRPGLYSGTSMDSLLHYLDQAGGIDPERGSFLNIEIKRNGKTRATINLYEFLLQGNMPLVQFANGDVIFVNARQNSITVSGLAENAKRFEFKDGDLTIADMIQLAKPFANTTHVRVVRNSGAIKNTEYYPLSDASQVLLKNGDELEFTADKKTGTITVRVEGEHESVQEYVLSGGSRLGDLIKRIELSERSDVKSIQLFRRSVKERQKQMLETSLRSLETAALTARSNTNDEAQLRADEARLLLQWVERAKQVEPSGQVFIASSANRNDLLLENGDILRIPSKDGLVLISGEVLFPNAVAFEKKLKIKDYIRRAGGYTQSANSSRVIIAHRDGSFDEGNGGSIFSHKASVRSGDVILVLPKIDVKSIQIAKDLTQILFQIAVSAKVVLGL